MSKDKEKGIIKVYDPIKGFGFITRNKGKDVFMYFGDFESKHEESVASIGNYVEFFIEKTAQGLRAKNIKLIS